ncbi:MAG: DUF2141 domain-containing protein [Treponema sp.]|nr:DUF2141 domain-containing protein [Treponema sp.]
MNKRILVVAAAILWTCAFAFGQAAPQASAKKRSVQITITNITTSSGTIVLSAHDSEESFKKRKPVQTVRIPATVPSVTIELSLEPGECAFCVFHDTNDDGDLNAGFMGIPKEPFGFSNYDGKGPPGNFKKHKVAIPAETEKLTIEIPLVKF